MYSNVGGCEIKHLFNKDKRKACEDAWYAKQSTKQTSADADLMLSQAAFAQASKGDGSWTATQTAGVLLASLAGIALLFVIIKKVGAKKAS
jgi:hypothetical protein